MIFSSHLLNEVDRASDRSVLALGGEAVESHDATLAEIFLARAGRSRQPVEVA